MRKTYRKIDDVLQSPLAAIAPPPSQDTTDRVLRSTRLEDSIYTDLRVDDGELEQIEQTAGEKLASFPALSRDVFQSFYSLLPRRYGEEALSVAARKFNAPILDHITQSEDFPTLKSVCEGRELPAYEAASEFISQAAGELDDLLSDLGGDKNALNTLEKLENAEEQAQRDLADLLERMQRCKERDAQLEQSVVDAANRVDSKRRQVEAVGKMIDTSAAQHKEDVTAIVSQAVSAATEKAEEVQNIIGAWSDTPGDLKKNEVNTDLLNLVRKSQVLKDISRYLGRFREIFAQGKRNGYAYGRGEKYSLELGNNISRALTSELAMLASPKTVPLFLQKYQRRQIKQYQRREPIYKGMGDIICCLDESISTQGDPAAWGKAVALTLLEIAADSGRSFALVHFAGSGDFQTDVFRPGNYTMQDKLSAAETFLNGGTDFQTPMEEALRLMKEEGFENADIVFVTDGECALPQEYLEQLHQEQTAHRFTVTGVLLDKGSPSMDFSLKKFCQNIYRTSQLLGDDIVRELVTKWV
ncbi:hypothetical protein [Flintibacter muris]|uniref:hypothetical protein n=1 Tax=Flintibacter muris TaxID=2941327 RepID=UPI0020413445|nr:hypothetical protein [Flintibacter muris]